MVIRSGAFVNKEDSHSGEEIQKILTDSGPLDSIHNTGVDCTENTVLTPVFKDKSGNPIEIP